MIHIPDSIFPENEKGEKICPACEKPLAECACPGYDPARPKTDQYRPHVRLEKKGRRGKAVTVISGLPPAEDYLKNLTRLMKSAAAGGGTFHVTDQTGIIELQGDHRTLAAEILRREGFAP